MHQKPISIHIFGHHNDIVDKQVQIIKALPNTTVSKHISTKLIKYLELVADTTDIVVINLSEQALLQLKALEESDKKGKSIVVVGDKKNIDLLSTAISVGVTQFIDIEDYQKDLLIILKKVVSLRAASNSTSQKRVLNAIINAKGGGGASFIASNVAYKISRFKKQNVALVDLDLQFGSIGLNFDVTPKYNLVEALRSIDELDYVSLGAYLNKYDDNLKLLLPSPEEIVLPGEIDPRAIKSMMSLLKMNYNQIVIDLPRLIDPVSTMILEQADHITIVIQQSLAQYRDGRRLIHIINKDLEIPLDKINVVINRYDSKNSLKKSDMIELLGHDKVFTVCNDFNRVATASNLGEPMCQSSPKSKIAKDIIKLSIFLGGIEIARKKSGMFNIFRSS